MKNTELAEKIAVLNLAVLRKMERWLALFEQALSAAENHNRTIDLKDVVAFTTTLKRVAEVTRATTILAKGEENESVEILDSQALRKLLSGED